MKKGKKLKRAQSIQEAIAYNTLQIALIKQHEQELARELRNGK